MKYTLDITRNEWGYVTNLSDWSGGKITPQGVLSRDGRHKLRTQFDIVIPGDPDSQHRSFGGYGYVRPWSDDGEAENALIKDWKHARGDKCDYYVALRNGSPDPEAVQLYYPERVFVTGMDEDWNPIPRSKMLQCLAFVGLRGAAGFWDPVQVFHGVGRGEPTFIAGLKADTETGLSWYLVKSDLENVKTKFPEAEWVTHSSSGDVGTLTVDLPE